jgi:hypothetical protein
MDISIGPDSSDTGAVFLYQEDRGLLSIYLFIYLLFNFLYFYQVIDNRQQDDLGMNVHIDVPNLRPSSPPSIYLSISLCLYNLLIYYLM